MLKTVKHSPPLISAPKIFTAIDTKSSHYCIVKVKTQRIPNGEIKLKIAVANGDAATGGWAMWSVKDLKIMLGIVNRWICYDDMLWRLSIVLVDLKMGLKQLK